MKVLILGVFIATIGLGVFVDSKEPVRDMKACVKINDTIYYDVPYSIQRCGPDSMSNLLFVFNVRSK